MPFQNTLAERIRQHRESELGKDPTGGSIYDLQGERDHAVRSSANPAGGDWNPYIMSLNDRISELHAGNVKKEEADKLEAMRQKDEDRLMRNQEGLSGRIQQLYNTTRDSGLEDIENLAIPERRRMIAEQAALGTYGSPVQQIPLGNLADRTQRSKTQFLGGLANQRMGQEYDLSKTIEGIMQGNNQFNTELSEKSRQFDTGLGYQKQKDAQDYYLKNKEIDENALASVRKSKPVEKDNWDKASSAAGTANVFSNVFKGWGAGKAPKDNDEV
jgi:hypothetical protein